MASSVIKRGRVGGSKKMANGNSRRTNWSIVIAGGALVLAVTSNVLNVVSGNTEKLEKRVGVIENDLTWKYVNKELAAKDIGFLNYQITELKKEKADRDIYEQKTSSFERQIVSLREHLRDIDRIQNQAFNARDAFASLQTRMLEIERSNRGK